MTGMPSGRPGESGTTQRRIPTSRAYWNLRAEQILNRVFEREAPIDLTPTSAPTPPKAPEPPPTAPEPPAPAETATPGAGAGAPSSPMRPVRRRVTTAPPMPRRKRRDSNLALLGLVGGVGALSALSGLLYLNHWNQMQRSLSQERNLLLMERLRELGPAAGTSAETGTTPGGAAPAAPSLPPLEGTGPGAAPPAAAALPASQPATAGAGQEAPPPPPEEAWISDLETLPSSSGPAPLRVPVTGRLTAPAPPARAAARPAARAPSQPPARPITSQPATAAPAASGPLPQLVGVVAAPGRAGTAIFQVDGTSTSVAVGQGIGSSGWRLRATAGDSALIERGGELRRVSIGSGF